MQNVGNHISSKLLGQISKKLFSFRCKAEMQDFKEECFIKIIKMVF